MFLKQAINLFKLENNEDQYAGHILYYLYNLLNNERYQVLESEIEFYRDEIKELPAFHRFLAWYNESQNKPETEIIAYYKKAFELSDNDEEKLRSIDLWIEYLHRHEPEKYEQEIEWLRKTRNELLATRDVTLIESK